MQSFTKNVEGFAERPCKKLAKLLLSALPFFWPIIIIEFLYKVYKKLKKTKDYIRLFLRSTGGMAPEYMANRDQKCVIFHALGSQQAEVDAFLKAVLEARARKTGDTGFPAGLAASGEFTTTSGAGLLQGGSPRKPSINAEKLALLDGETVQDVLCMGRRDTCGDWIKAIFTFGIFYFLVMKPRRAFKQSLVRTNRRLIDVCCRPAGASSCCGKLPPQEICTHYLDMVPLAVVSTGTNIKPDGTPGPPQVMKCGCCPVARHIKFETHIMFRSGVLGTAMDSEEQSLAEARREWRGEWQAARLDGVRRLGLRR